MDEKPWYLSKTVVFNLVALAVAVAGAFGYADHVADEWVSQANVVVVAIINLGLRFVTAKPLG